MLEEIMNKIRQFGQSLVVNNPAIPNEHNEHVMQEAGSSIYSGLQEHANSGNADAMTGLLSGDANHPAVAGVQNNFMQNIMQKFGIGSNAAGSVSGLIPSVLGSLLHRPGTTNSGGMSLKNILSSLTGSGNNNSHGLLSSIGTKLGLDRDGDGDVDMQDLSSLLK